MSEAKLEKKTNVCKDLQKKVEIIIEDIFKGTSH